MAMAKKICKEDKKPKIRKTQASFECKSCGELARKEKQLCKPKKI